MKRLDQKLFELGLAPSRSKAAEMIKAGLITVDGQRSQKPSFRCSEASEITVDSSYEHYVSRGAYKLEAMVQAIDLSIEGRRCLDVGASTGGFTDYLLRCGASRVVAVDVGTLQLSEHLRENPRVTSMEQTDIRYVALPVDELSIICVDVSFISLTCILPAIRRFYEEGKIICGADIILLIKPQFEMGKRHRGVVRDPKLRKQAVKMIELTCTEMGIAVGTVIPSPILGGAGNQEFLLHGTIR